MGTESPTQREVLKRLRDQAGLTQGEAAEALNMNKRTYGAYEREERDISFNKMQRARRVLGEEKYTTQAMESSSTAARSNAVKEYPVADDQDGAPATTIYVDTRILAIDKNIPGPEEATAHLVNGRMMGIWMQRQQYVIARDCKEIGAAGRYVVRWAGGEEKIVVEGERRGNRSVLIRTHAPQQERMLSQGQRENGETTYQDENGSDVTIETIGKVVLPSDKPRQLVETVSDQLSRMVSEPAQEDGIFSA